MAVRDRSKRNEWRRQNYKKNPRKYLNARRADVERNPEKEAIRLWLYHIKTHYNMSVEQYEQLLVKQNGVCAICKQPSRWRLHLNIDHDHKCCSGNKSCGKCIRGLLCEKCNPALGAFGDDKELLLAAVKYLETSGTWQ